MPPSLAFAFLLGVLATVNPCGLALLPAYFTNRLRDAPSRSGLPSMARALMVAGATTFGMASVFLGAAALVSLGVHWISTLLPWFAIFVGIGLIALGVAVAGGRKIALGSGAWNAIIPSARAGLRGDASFGAGYGIASLSCAFPLFLSAIGLGLNGSLRTNIGNFAAYILGMATIFAALSISAGLARDALSPWLKRSQRYMRYINGAFLVFAGAYVTVLWSNAFLGNSPIGLPLLDAGEALSEGLRRWFDSAAGMRSILGVFIFLVALVLWVSYNHIRPGRTRR